MATLQNTLQIPYIKSLMPDINNYCLFIHCNPYTLDKKNTKRYYS